MFRVYLRQQNHGSVGFHFALAAITSDSPFPALYGYPMSRRARLVSKFSTVYQMVAAHGRGYRQQHQLESIALYREGTRFGIIGFSAPAVYVMCRLNFSNYLRPAVICAGTGGVEYNRVK